MGERRNITQKASWVLQKVISKSDLKNMFDGKGASKPESNAAVELADDLYHSLLRDTLESSNNLWKVEKYLAELKRNDPCFDYQIARDEITGAPTCVV